MPEITRRVRIGKILKFSIDQRVFSKMENRFGMLTDRTISGNIGMSLWAAFLSLITREQAEFNQGFLALVLEKNVKNVWLHARDNHLCYVLGTKRKIFDMEAIIIPRKVRIVLPQVLPLSRAKMPEAPPLRRVLRLHWSDRTSNGNKIVIGGAQRRGTFDKVSRRVGI